MDGSGRISLCNRVHLRPLLVIKPHLPLGTLPDRDAELPIPQNEVQLSVPPVNNSVVASSHDDHQGGDIHQIDMANGHHKTFCMVL